MDFNVPYIEDGETKYWSKIWNCVPRGNDYTAFVQATLGYPMADYPLCEIGCPYAVRGFDFDYVGLLWLSDLVIRDGKWTVNIDHVHESSLRPYVRRALSEDGSQEEHTEALTHKVCQAYRILLTRAMNGVYLWFEDDETKDHISQAMGTWM